MRLIMLLVATVSAENNFVLNDARIRLKMRQSSTLTKRPLSDVVNVSLHQSQVFPSEAEAACLRPNVAFTCRMSDLTGTALARRERLSGGESIGI
jgi:hypothetical protein